jgi:hypothetical protein
LLCSLIFQGSACFYATDFVRFFCSLQLTKP